MHRSYVLRRPFGPTLRHLVTLVTLAAGVACSSSGEDEPSQRENVPDPGAAPLAPSGAGSGGTGGSASQAPPALPTPPGEGMSSTPLTPPGGVSTTPASTDSVSVGDVCDALGSDDACAACVCGACTSELDACAGTPGCAEILACVRDNGCSGTDCYCGDARLTECFRGGGNGPCKAAVLAAPDGKEPTLANPSGGPASDAALKVADCADEDETCGNVCDIGG